MSSFTIKKNVKSFEIKAESGEVLKSYNIDVGNYEALKTWSSKIDKIENMSKNMGKTADIFDDLKDLEKDIIIMVLGDWDWVWETFEHNIFSILALVRALSDLVGEAMKEFYNQYV